MADLQEVFDYVMHTPYNTNPNVLISLLNSVETQDEDEEESSVSFAEITLTPSSDIDAQTIGIYGPIINNDALISYQAISASEPTTLSVLMYNGASELYINSDAIVFETSGMSKLNVTGDSSI